MKINHLTIAVKKVFKTRLFAWAGLEHTTLPSIAEGLYHCAKGVDAGKRCKVWFVFIVEFLSASHPEIDLPRCASKCDVSGALVHQAT